MATLYDDISLGYHACGGSKVGKLYSFKPTDGSGDFTCVRATTPNRINKDGDTEVVPVNTPVIDWSTGSPLLIVTVEGELTLTTPASATKIVITIDGEDVEYNNVFPTLSLPVGSITKVIATVGGTEYDLLKAYLLRVDTANGTINEQGARDLKSMYEFLDDEGLLSGLELLYLSNAGMVQRTDGVLKYVRTAFDASDNDNDLDGSATASQQPRLVGGIAPGSKVAAANLNGEARYFTHPAISFAANEEYSITTVHNWNNGNTADERHFGQANSAVNTFALKVANNNLLTITFGGTSYASVLSTNELIGKTAIVSYVVKSGSKLIVYFNGIEKLNVTVPNDTLMTFNSIFNGRDTGRMFNGKWLAYHIQSGALTATQVTALYNTLRGMYPEIESVTIGSQVWASRNFEAVATPLGNVIANVTENGAVEKIVNAADREFSSDTGWWTMFGGNISSGTFNITGTNGFISRSSAAIIGKWYKCIFTLSGYTSGVAGVSNSFTTDARRIVTASGTYSLVLKATGNSIGFVGQSGCVFDNVSVQELNWSNATEIYDAVYAATSGDAATKEYAALKEAAMWCYYNNDPANGAIYGKLYNWYAAKLLDLDMVTAGFGWRVPTSAQFTTLATYLGGASVAGGKMKMTGEDYWVSPNTGATNESGFTALGGSIRTNTGIFGTIGGLSSNYWSTNIIGGIYSAMFKLFNTSAAFESQSFEQTRGFSLRLIKNS